MSADALAAAVGAALGAEVAAAQAVHGGSINRALRLTLADGRAAFVKHHPDAPPGVFRAEADGLAWLADAGALRTPGVLAVADDAAGGPRFLALEWIAPGPPDPEAFGRGLAGLHRAGAPAFGWDRDNFIGPLPQRNDPVPGGWPEFYAERRLRPMAEQAVAAGTLDPRFLADLDRLRARLPDLAGPPEQPARPRRRGSRCRPRGRRAVGRAAPAGRPDRGGGRAGAPGPRGTGGRASRRRQPARRSGAGAARRRTPASRPAGGRCAVAGGR